MQNIKIIEVRSELGAGTRGASLGIDALKVAARNANNNFFANHPSDYIPTENHLLDTEEEHPNAKRIDGISIMYERIANAVSDCISNNNFPLVLAGDHSNAGGTIAGLKMANPNRRLGIVWIDAHADLHTPFTSPSGNVHGMPLAAALNTDNIEQKANEPNSKTLHYWQQLKTIGGIAPKVNPEDIVFIALRDFEQQEEYIIQENGIKVVSVQEVQRDGFEQVVRSTISHLNECNDIYVSFDVDSLDSNISVGTGTPVANGLSEREAEGLLTHFIKSDKLCCLEVTEVNPTLDTENAMANVTFNILNNSIKAASE